MDFQSGQPRHFPEGTYSQQMAHSLGGLELEMMDLMYRLWRAFVRSSPGEWPVDSDEMTIAHWLQQREPLDYETVNRLIWIDNERT